jgi:hypothetical protein
LEHDTGEALYMYLSISRSSCLAGDGTAEQHLEDNEENSPGRRKFGSVVVRIIDCRL